MTGLPLYEVSEQRVADGLRATYEALAIRSTLTSQPPLAWESRTVTPGGRLATASGNAAARTYSPHLDAKQLRSGHARFPLLDTVLWPATQYRAF